MGTFEDLREMAERRKMNLSAVTYAHLPFTFLLIASTIGYVHSINEHSTASAVGYLLTLYFSIYKIGISITEEFLEVVKGIILDIDTAVLAGDVEEVEDDEEVEDELEGDELETESDESIKEIETESGLDEATATEEMSSSPDNMPAPTSSPEPPADAPVEVPDEVMTTYEDDVRKANDERVRKQLQEVVDETNERNRQRALLDNPAYTFVIPEINMDQLENAMPSITRIDGLSTLYDETTIA